MSDQTLYNQLIRQKNGRGRHWLITLLTVVVVGWGAGACQEYDVERTFQGPYFVQFTDTSATYKESYSKPIAIEVHNAGPQLSQPITIKYTVSGTAREGKDYTIVGTKGTVVIPANQSKGSIMVKLINNANNILDSQSLTFTLTSVDPSTLQVGFGTGEVPIGKSFTLNLNDDCLFGGFYTGSSVVDNKAVSVADVEITSTDCKQYTLSNWNIGLSNFVVVGNSTLFSFNAEKPTLTFTDNGDNSLTVPAQSNAALGSNGSLSGTGAWNPRNRQISLNLQATVRIAMIRDTVTTYRDTTLFFSQTYTPQ
ncbi:Calx-beta domain-containing protein [Spirosoma sp. SC4-14]|uniref:Calx-beta domain-containing protein n=1 Tax=Spirosoma sp. SC4-14 TaxID=3128900 RepID=UPI0030CCD4F6